MNRKNLLGAAISALLVSMAAHAEDSGFYLGLSLGEATQSVDEFEGSGLSYRWLAGYSFNRFLAAEAGFVDGGTQKDRLGDLGVKLSSNGTFVAALAKLPIGEVLAPFAKVGYVVYDARTTLTSGGVTVTESESDQDLMYGAGIEFRLGDHFRLRAEYEVVDVPDVDFDIVSLVATYQF
jgi:opacity protein-like surface antigen